MPRKDPYDILGVSRTSSADEIKSAYRRLAKQYHPDRNRGDQSSEQKFKEVQAAYEVLGDADKRAQFDRFGEGGPAPNFDAWQTHFRNAGPGGGGAPSGGGFDFADVGDLGGIFEQFFSRGGGGGVRTRVGRGARRAPAAPGRDVEHEVQVSFDEALRGTTREVVLRLEGPAGVTTERIEFRIPPGVEDGQRVRVRGKGEDGAAGRGDLLIRVAVASHPWFRRDGRDILLDLPLSFAEAALGAQVDVPTLDGDTTLKIPPGTSSGAKLRLRGKGLSDARGGERGDMYVIVRIVAPRHVSGRAAALIEELNEALGEDPRKDAAWRR